jgi:hypothetical protein
LAGGNSMMETIQDIFNKHFAHWQITLPEENVRKKESGYIEKAVWVKKKRKNDIKKPGPNIKR